MSFTLLASPACAWDLTGYAVLTSDYVFRGVTYSDGHPAVQGGVDVSQETGVYFGLWGSTADISGGATRHRDRQLNYYLGYTHEVSSAWSIGGTVVGYTFPATEGDIDYDYFEYSVVANYDDRLWLEYSYSPELILRSRQTHNLDLYAEWPLPASLVAGAGVGFYDASALSDSYGYWQLGLTRSIGRFDLDLRYHDTTRSVPIISTPERSKSRVVVTLKLLF